MFIEPLTAMNDEQLCTFVGMWRALPTYYVVNEEADSLTWGATNSSNERNQHIDKP